MTNCEQTDPKTAWGKTAVIWMTSSVLLLAPDLVFQIAGYNVISTVTAEALLTVGVLALLLTLMPSRRGKFALIAFATLGQLIWLGCIRYFGSVLRPDHILLIGSELSDAAIGAATEFGNLLPILALVAAVATGLCLLQLGRFASHSVHMRGAGILVCVLLLGLAARWAFWKNAVVAFPGLHGFGHRHYHASIAAVRFALAPAKAAPGLVVREPQVAVAEVPDEPVTILFIMGESINPVRLSLLGPRRTLLPTCAHGARTRQRYAPFLPHRICVGGCNASERTLPNTHGLHSH